jgi:hypothetical protein
MPKSAAFLMALSVLTAAAPAAERVTCPAIAATTVEPRPWTAQTAPSPSPGAQPDLVITGRDSLALLAFDTQAARGLRVEKATLRVRRKPDSTPLTVVGVSTISGAGAWSENEANTFEARKGRPWSYAGSDFTDVTFGPGGSLYAYVRARDAGNGWWEIDVPPQIATALITGDQFGLLLSDEKGQTHTSHAIAGRKSADAPTLVIDGSRSASPAGQAHSLPPPSVQELGRSSLRPGSVILRFGGASAARYDLRYSEAPLSAANFDAATPAPRWMLDPLAPKRQPLAESNSLRDEVTAVVEQLQPGRLYYFAARAISPTGEAGPVALLGSTQATPARQWPSLPAAAPAVHPPAPPAGGPVKVWSFSELHKVDPQTGELLEKAPVWTGDVRLTGAANEFVAFQIAIESETPLQDITVSVDQPLFAECKLPPVFELSGAVQLYREWMVPDEKDRTPARRWYPEALIPLVGAFHLPAADNAVPRQRVQPVFVDIYIPHGAAAGPHRGAIAVKAGGQLLRRIPMEVEVLPLTLPDRLNFIVDFNAYFNIVQGWNLTGWDARYHALTRAYHQLAHLHRANLDVLPYAQGGYLAPHYDPPLNTPTDGAKTKVEDWSNWDALFGPLLSGGAFAGLPRAGVPVPFLYLPFCENWPGDLRKNYRWDVKERPRSTAEYRQMIARHALEAGPIEEGFTQSYQDRFSAVAREFAAHLRKKQWLRTKYEIFLNSKYYFKDPASGGAGISWWLLDEPNHRDDYRALGFFGWLAKRGLAQFPDVPVLFRTDISWVDYIRDQLSGVVDLDVVSDRFFTKNRFLNDNRARFGRTYWNYGSSNHPRESNVAMRAWCWRAWLDGADGIVPWNTVDGGMGAWDVADAQTLFYVGRKFGSPEPFASLRMKAYRRGQQDIEYLILLAARQGWDREAVSRAAAGALDLTQQTRRESQDDAGTLSFEGVTDEQLDLLRLRVAAALRR